MLSIMQRRRRSHTRLTYTAHTLHIEGIRWGCFNRVPGNPPASDPYLHREESPL